MHIVYTCGFKASFIVFHPCVFPVNEVIVFLWVMLNLYSPPPLQRFRKEKKKLYRGLYFSKNKFYIVFPRVKPKANTEISCLKWPYYFTVLHPWNLLKQNSFLFCVFNKAACLKTNFKSCILLAQVYFDYGLPLQTAGTDHC